MALEPENSLLQRRTSMNLTIYHLAVILSISGMIIASVSLVIGTLAFINCQALKASTHTMEYMPVDTAVDDYNKALLDEDKSGDWATSPDSLRKQREMFNEDVDSSMPEFSTTDEDREIISF